MGKSLRDYREQNEEAIRFFDGYASPALKKSEWRPSIYIPAPLPKPKKPRTTFPGLNFPLASRELKKTPSSPNGQRQRMKRSMYAEQKGICMYCDDPITFEEATFDHILAQWKGGSNKRSNLVLVCYPCNSLKGDVTTIEEANHRIFVFSEFIARLAKKGYLK